MYDAVAVPLQAKGLQSDTLYELPYASMGEETTGTEDRSYAWPFTLYLHASPLVPHTLLLRARI
jgi:hypothetical protein